METWSIVLVGLTALILSAAGGWPLTSGVLRLAARSPDAGGVESDLPAPAAPVPGAGGVGEETDAAVIAVDGDGPVGPAARAALRGGTWIGILERLAITGTLIAGYPAGIAFVIAIKGLGRYPELREHPGTSERFVIGTLASMLWAAVVGAVLRMIVEG